MSVRLCSILAAASLVLLGCGSGGEVLTVESDCTFDVVPGAKLRTWAEECPNGLAFPTENGNPLALLATMAEQSKSITVYVIDDGLQNVAGEHLLDWDLSGNLLVLVINRDALPLGADAPVAFEFEDRHIVCEVGASIVIAECLS